MEPSPDRNLPVMNQSILPSISNYPGEEGVYREIFAAEDRLFWFRARNAIIAAAMDRATRNFCGEHRMLEIGCGTGNVLRVLETHGRGAKVFGMDLFSAGFRYARQRACGCLVQADMYYPPFKDSFDLIGMFDV